MKPEVAPPAIGIYAGSDGGLSDPVFRRRSLAFRRDLFCRNTEMRKNFTRR